ncbi:MAG: TldD/PmbA family protein [Clostridia bacterium]|nr:TldD/PmbA family protein [Clostridia bacterium]
MISEQFRQELVEKGRKAGFDACEAYIVRSDSFEGSITEGEIRDYQVSSDLGMGFRGLWHGKMGYASTQVLEEAEIGEVIARARANAEVIDSGDPQMLFAGSEAYPQVDAFNPALEEITAREKLERALELEQAAKRVDPRVTKLEDCGVFTSSTSVQLTNSYGLNLEFQRNGGGMYVSPIARSGEDVSTGMAFRYGRDFACFSAEELAAEAVRESVSGLGAKPAASGKYPVLLRNDAAATLLSTFFGVFSADAAQKGFSRLKGREGSQIASGILTIRDDPFLKDGYSRRRFDGEGVACRAKSVVSSGVLTTLLHNLKTARKQGVETTANASRPGYASSIGISASNFFIEPGTASRDALVRQAGRGILVTSLMGMHAGASAVTGDFSLGARGFLIENGEVSRPVKGITIAGNFYEMLRHVEAVADDLYFGFPGGAVFGSPSVLIESLTVAGE